MKIWEAIILGLVQGLTEFLPVSSSGHLVLTERLLGLTGDNIRFIIVVHLGTLLAVLAVYRRQVGRLLRGVFVGRIRRKNGRWRFKNPDTRMVVFLAVATIPAALFGFLAADWIRGVFSRPGVVGLSLIATGAVLFGLRWVRKRPGEMNFLRALVVGAAQAAAIFPGISRSGMTISAGIYSGIERTKAADFSFLLSIPIILGAALHELPGVVGEGIPDGEIPLLLIGALTAAVFGYAAIKILLRLIQRGELHYFAYYCWLVGLVVLILSG